jgi:hypothetical protein
VPDQANGITDRTIGGNQQRKNVESISFATGFQPRIVTRSIADLIDSPASVLTG